MCLIILLNYLISIIEIIRFVLAGEYGSQLLVTNIHFQSNLT